MKIAVVVPVRNAAKLLPDCLASIRRQSMPPDELWLIVGPSTDGTADAAQTAGSEIRVEANPAGDRGSAINVALAATDADLIALVDAQARLEPDYLEKARAAMQDPSAFVVGGPMRPRGQGTVGEAMAAALRSPLGVGDSQFHFEGHARDVDSVYLGVYRSEVYRRVGLYNPALLRTEDDDMNARVRAAGMRIRLDPAIRSSYLCRDDLPSIWRQYIGYGFWKVALATAQPQAMRARHFAPALFVAAVFVAVVASLTLWPWAVLLVLGPYVVALVLGAALARATPRTRLLFPIVVATMHLAYGLGSLLAVPRWRSLGEKVRTAGRSVRPGQPRPA